MMSKKNITFAIPIYNVEKYLDSCLDSMALESNYDDIEVLLINDGSPKNEESICKSYTEKYPYMHYIKKENGGYGSVINYALSVANGKYFKMLDSDDLLQKENINNYINFVRFCDTDIIVNDIEVFDDLSGNTIDYYCCPHFENKNISDINLSGKHLFLHNFTIKTELIRDILCPKKCLYTDAALLCYGFARAKSISSLGYTLYKYRLGRMGQSASIEVVIKHTNDYLSVYNHICSNFINVDSSKMKTDFFLEIQNCVLYNYLKSLILGKGINSYKDIKNIIKKYKEFKKKNSIKSNSEGKAIKMLSVSCFNYIILLIKFRKDI